MLFRVLCNEKRVSWEALLVDGLGWTQDRADREITKTLAEMVIFSPEFIGAVGEEAMEKMGMTKQLEKLKAKAAEQRQSQTALSQASPVEATPRTFNTSNPTARETIRQMMSETQGIRGAPERGGVRNL